MLNPSLSAAYRKLGAVYIDKHEWKKAEQSLEKGTTLNPHDHLTFYWLGRSLLAQERFCLAQTALSTATQLEPNNSETQSDLALALMAQGLFQEAEAALKTAIRLQPDFAEAHHRLEQVQAADANPHELIQSANRFSIPYFTENNIFHDSKKKAACELTFTGRFLMSMTRTNALRYLPRLSIFSFTVSFTVSFA